jgi:predicted Zn-dependent protease
MTGKLGEKVMGENITIWDDALDPAGRPFPFDSEGVARKKVMLIEDGVAVGPVYDTITAVKDGTESTGHASSPVYAGGPSPQNLFMTPGDSSVDEMVSSVRKGLLITRFHYVNGLLDTRKALFTGMTRDGSFLIENGKVGRPVKNLRFTQNMLEAFSNVEALSKDVGRVQAVWGDGAFVVPSMLIRGFRFTGSTEF